MIKESHEHRIQSMNEMEKRFAELTNKYAPCLLEALKPTLSPLELMICTRAEKRLNAGRWYDCWGIPESAIDFKWILQEEGVSTEQQLLALAILWYHDSGYPPNLKSEEYADVDMREFHMREGTLHFIQDLCHIRREEGPYLFTRREIANAADTLIQHDDKFLGNKSIHSDLFGTFLDGDTIFIPSFVSMYKDFLSRYGRPQSETNPHDMKGEEFLAMRQCYFFRPGEEESYHQKIRITPATEEKFEKKRLPVKFETTKKVIAAHMLARTQECEQGLFEYATNGDWNQFRPHAVEYFEKSIEAVAQGRSYDALKFELEHTPR
ncbi:hypothetical protein J4457_03830 [Candidatus Woesearchaeota archaeon]|nr:hypothetical protein [Candidatus Woesearchaeota archaeon]